MNKRYLLEIFTGVVAAIGTLAAVIWWAWSGVSAWWGGHWLFMAIVGIIILAGWTCHKWVPIVWNGFRAVSLFKEDVLLLASVRARVNEGHTIKFSNERTGVQFELSNPYAVKSVKVQEELVTSQEQKLLGGPSEVIPAVVSYESIASQIPFDQSLLGIYPETGDLEIVDPERYKTAWFVGGSNMGKTNTVYGKVADAVRWGAKIIICDSHAHKKDSLANKLRDFHGRLLRPVAQTDEQIKGAIVAFLREFKSRRDLGRPCTEKWLIVADEVNATANHMVRISKEEAASLLEEFGLKIEDEFVKLQVFFKFLAETCGYESRGFEMFGYFISQKVAGLSWLRNAMMTVFVHGLLMDSEALLAANNSRKQAEMIKAFKTGRTLVYGLDFDPVILQQPKYEIGQVVDSTIEVPASNEDGQANNNLVYFSSHQKRREVEIDTGPFQAQKKESDETRIARVTQLMIEGTSVNKIIKEEWGLDSGGGAYQVALNELRAIQKIIASRAVTG